MILGFSTGCLYKNIEPVSIEAINLIKSTKCNAIELCAGFKERITQLESISKSDLKGFEYVSLHAPDNMMYDDSSESMKILDAIARQHQRFHFNRVVIHGNNVVSGEIFRKYNLPIAIENHDTRFGKNVEEMKDVFKRFDADMVLDVLHSYIAAKSFSQFEKNPSRLTHELCAAFKDEIVEVHLSGLGKHDDYQQHYPINEMKQLDILKSVPLNVPIIIESVFLKYLSQEKLLEQLAEEYAYIKKYFS